MSENESILAVITADGCPHCADFKKKNKPLLDSGKIRELNLTSDDFAVKIAQLLDINAVPTLVSIKKDKVCKLDHSLKEEKCVVLPEHG